MSEVHFQLPLQRAVPRRWKDTDKSPSCAKKRRYEKPVSVKETEESCDFTQIKEEFPGAHARRVFSLKVLESSSLLSS